MLILISTNQTIWIIAARDGNKSSIITVTYTNSTLGNATAGVVSAVGGGTALVFQMGTDDGTGLAKYLTATLAAGDTSDDIADAMMTAINADQDYAATTLTSSGSNVFKVVRRVSGTATTDMSPLALAVATPSLVIDAAQTSTTATLTPSAYNVSSNLAGKNSSLWNITIGKLDKNGLRVSLKNVGSLAFPSAVTLTGDTASNTAITTGAAAPNGENGLLVDGVSIASYNATTDPNVANYVTAFSEVSAGTTTTTTAAVTAVNLIRTGW